MFQRLTNEEFLENLKKYNVKYMPLELYKKAHTKMKFQCDKNPNHIFETTPSDIYSGNTHCPYCMRRKVFVGETDAWTERPDVAKLLLNPEDGYKYFATGSQYLDFVCPNCKSIIKHNISIVSRYGLYCSHCGDGMSFGEKFVNELLKQLQVEFVFNKATQWSDNKRYDFIIKSMSLIIEVHGAQHYRTAFSFKHSSRKSKSLEEEQANDVYKKSLAMNNGIKHYVELDCRNSDYEFVKQSVLESELSKLYDLSNIDWEKCFEATGVSNVKRCADLWNGGMKNTKEISEEICMNRTSVIEYLKKAKMLGLCDYDTNYAKNKNLYNVIDVWNNQTKDIKEISQILGLSYAYVNQLLLFAQENDLCDYKRLHPKQSKQWTRKVKCIETQKIYESIISTKLDGYNHKCIYNCLNNRSKTACGKHWEYVN